jgi:hypothetical protein
LNASNPQSAMYDVLSLRDHINVISSKFVGIGPVFGPISLNLPKLEPAELGFIRVVSWLFVGYFEIGKLGTEFLSELAVTFNISTDQLNLTHRKRVQQLRTYCQHNLKPDEAHTKEIQSACEGWFTENCGTPAPSDNTHWERILLALISEARFYFGGLEKVLRKIEQSESREQILGQWALRISRFHAPHEFDKVVAAVAADFGRESFDSVKFRKRYYDRWRKEFEVRTDDCDFEREARKLIEHALLSELENVLPINGTDIMREFSIPPGHEVKNILAIAKEIFNSAPCTNDRLYHLIRERITLNSKITEVAEASIDVQSHLIINALNE